MAGDKLEALALVADNLCEELGYGETSSERPRSGAGAFDTAHMAGALGPREEWLVLRLRRCLGDLVTRVARTGASPRPLEAARTALDGVETVMRGELLNGDSDRVAAQLPSFVFLVTLPILGQDRALELSSRTLELIEEALRD